MKAIQTALVSAFVLLSINTVSAQYGNNGYGNGYGGAGYSRNSGMSQDRSQEKPKEIPVEVTVGKIMEKLKTELTLDALQEIAISNVLKESIKAQGILIKGEGSQDDKTKEFQALSETTDRKIKEFLNKEQKEKYLILAEEAKNPKKSRKK